MTAFFLFYFVFNYGANLGGGNENCRESEIGFFEAIQFPSGACHASFVYFHAATATTARQYVTDRRSKKYKSQLL